MDLTKFLRPSNKVNSPAIENRREQYKNKSKIGSLANRKNRATEKAQLRKQTRSKQFQNRRGIVEESDYDNEFSVIEDKKENVVQSRTKRYAGIDLAEKQKERLKKLQEFKENKKLQKQKEKESKLPPFRAGIRGLRSSEIDLYSSSSVVPTLSSTFLTTKRPQPNNTRLFVFTGKNEPIKEKSTKVKKKIVSTTQRVTRSQKAKELHEENFIAHQIDSQINSAEEILSEPEVNADIKTPPNPIVRTKQSKCTPFNPRVLTPEISSEESDVEANKVVPTIIVENSSSDKDDEDEKRDIVTPLKPLRSIKRCTSVKNSKFISNMGNKSSILTPNREDITYERGSFSDRRREKAGKSGRKSFAEELDFDNMPMNMDDGCPARSEVMNVETSASDKNENTVPITINELEDSFSGDVKAQSKSKNLESMDHDKEEVTVKTIEKETLSDIQSSSAMDVPYFKSLLAKETERLTSLCEQWETKLSGSFNEDCKSSNEEREEIEGKIRATIGKANILMNKKGRFHQFQDLINNCEFNLGEKKTTCTDLQGFWEMIYFQVEGSIKDFSDLDDIEKNNWTLIKPEAVKVSKKPLKKAAVINGSKKTPSKAKKPTSNLREIMAAKRREMALAKKKEQDDNSGCIITNEQKETERISPNIPPTEQKECSVKPESPVNTEEKVFDGRFFSIQSPVASKTGTPVSTTRLNNSSTPISQKNTPVQR